MKLANIKIQPTNWRLEIIVGATEKQLESITEKRYGIYHDPIVQNETNSINTCIRSESKGEKLVIISIKTLQDKATLVHELIHALWHISKFIGYKLTYDTQEWQAILFEYLYNEATNPKIYKKIEY